MNREIKFRGLADGDWFYGSLFVSTGSINNGQAYISDYGSMVDHGMSDVVNEVALGFFREVGNETVGQHTGLLDKNGTEIYEGDIVEYYDSSIESDVISPVSWLAPMFVVDSGLLYFRSKEANKVFDGKIIGNIYEHPHLIEGAD